MVLLDVRIVPGRLGLTFDVGKERGVAAPRLVHDVLPEVDEDSRHLVDILYIFNLKYNPGRDMRQMEVTRGGQVRAEGGEMEQQQTLRQATKLWPEEIDPEFGEAIPWLQNARQARGCEPRAAPLQEPGRRAIA